MQELEAYHVGDQLYLDELYDIIGGEISLASSNKIFGFHGFVETFRGSGVWRKTESNFIITDHKGRDIDIAQLAKVVYDIGGDVIKLKQIKERLNFRPTMKSVRSGMLRLGWERNEHQAYWRRIDEME